MSRTYVDKYARENGLTKIDATKPMILNVNDKDVKTSKLKNSKECAGRGKKDHIATDGYNPTRTANGGRIPRAA